MVSPQAPRDDDLVLINSSTLFHPLFFCLLIASLDVSGHVVLITWVVACVG